MKAKCPQCSYKAESIVTQLTTQISGKAKAYVCGNPACDVIHFKDNPRTLAQ
ncbi:hypothetical protein [Methanohalobium sp.]|uniref:hypothetical protein n=1 Tax=Methanohalobium sp. TaxID=2837493 RepID=UPI0025FD8B79|nr:hypothetical protein [Methanohalobium sp.]